MDNRLKLPVGIEDFEEIRKEGFYYIDKTKLIEQLLMNWGNLPDKYNPCHAFPLHSASPSNRNGAPNEFASSSG